MVLEIQNLSKKFGNFTALQDINLVINKGEVCGFIGPNGAGKSTTIRTILGIYKPTSGVVSVFGQDAWKDGLDIHKRISYVPGDVNLWPNLTGGEVIDLFIKLRGGKINPWKEELIKKFNLDVRKKCRTYSKGNRQKVALISAFATDADLYIFDEPTSGLDPLMESVFHEFVLRVKAQGKSVLLSSHILSEVEKLCDKISIIKDGTIIQSGTIDSFRHLKRFEITVRTNDIIPLDSLNYVYKLTKTDNGAYAFEVDAEDLSTIIAYMGTFNVEDFKCTQPSLEKLFMTHYEGDLHE